MLRIDKLQYKLIIDTARGFKLCICARIKNLEITICRTIQMRNIT